MKLMLCVDHKMRSLGWKLNAGIDFLEFKPSEIAAAVALYVLGAVDVDDKAKAVWGFIQEKVVMNCIALGQLV